MVLFSTSGYHLLPTWILINVHLHLYHPQHTSSSHVPLVLFTLYIDTIIGYFFHWRQIQLLCLDLQSPHFGHHLSGVKINVLNLAVVTEPCGSIALNPAVPINPVAFLGPLAESLFSPDITGLPGGRWQMRKRKSRGQKGEKVGSSRTHGPLFFHMHFLKFKFKYLRLSILVYKSKKKSVF